MGLIGVFMGEEHRIDVIDLGADELLAQVRRCVDHNPCGAAFTGLLHQEGAAQPPIFRICRIAGAPAERRPGHTSRRSAAENGERERHGARGAGTLENKRKKFSVVCREISSSETPRASASTLATSTT